MKKAYWQEDDATCYGGDPDHETVDKAWKRLFGEDLDTCKAVKYEDLGDAFMYTMPNWYTACLSYRGNSAIYHPEKK